MEFSPKNKIVSLCMQGMSMEEEKPNEAGRLFQQAWHEATNDFEKFLAGYYVAKSQETAAEKLKWFETALELAFKINDDAVRPAFGLLYKNIAHCYQELNDQPNAEENIKLANSASDKPTDNGPFYHGTKANLAVGEFLTPGHDSNYKDGLTMNHIYFTAMLNGAGLAAALAKGDGADRVYMVEPTGDFENDPNVTNKKFPGNPTRSYRTAEPLKIIGEVVNWNQQTPEELQKWRDRLANNQGEIIN